MNWMRPFTALAIATLLVMYSPIGARFFQPELENVPVDRLVANLERLSSEEPANTWLHLNLARVHAMAYAYKTNTAQIVKGLEREGAWTGYGPRHALFEVKPARDQAAEKAARAHLEQAIVLYRKMLTGAAPQFKYSVRLDRMAQLGLGWCLAQAGERDAAIAALRQVVATGWPADPNDANVLQRQRSMTEEAVHYLVPLLDAERDKEEIVRLRSRASELERMLRPITPLAIPLSPDLTAAEITNGAARVLFDADGSGLARRWTWITADAGWLVFDKRGTRQIGSALQLFGNVTFWLFWENGYHALRALDDNGDRRLTGAELAGLAIWHDRNVNGISDPGEVRTLGEWNIVALSCEYEIDAAHPDEIAYSPAGATFRDGSTRPTFDLILHPSANAAARVVR